MWRIVVIGGMPAFSKDGGLSEPKCTTPLASQLLGLGHKMIPAEKRKQQEIKMDAGAWQSSRDKASAERKNE